MAAKISDGSHAKRDIARGLQTKEIVKGAAGGIRGVDYQDLDKQYLELRDGAAATNVRASDKEAQLAKSLLKAAAEGRVPGPSEQIRAAKANPAQASDGIDARNVVNAAAAQTENERVDPKVQIEVERVKKKILTQSDDEVVEEYEEEYDDDDETSANDEELSEELVWLGPFADIDVDRALDGVSCDVIAQMLKDPDAELRVYGTTRLTDPSDMRKALGSPLRVARHLRVLSERLLKSDQYTRDDVVSYVAASVVSMGQDFGGSALRAFASSVGISGVYPLEVVDYISRHQPSFVPRTTLAPFLSGRRRRVLRAGKAEVLHCDPDLKITGLALKGGGEPGYQFVPRAEPGEFFLNVLTPGEFTLILSAVDPYGFERVQELRLLVTTPNADDLTDAEDDVTARQRTISAYRMPDQAADGNAPAETAAPSKKKKKKKKPTAQLGQSKIRKPLDGLPKK